MSWMICNVHGFNKRYKQKELRHYLRTKHIKLANLLETRVKKGKAKGILTNVFRGWMSINNYYVAANGRVWVIWDQRHYDDRLFCQPVTNTELKDFTECIHDLGLAELTWTENYYTWTNKQQGSDKIYSRIDRALGNDEWMLNWEHVRTEYDLQNFSDHCPMILKEVIPIVERVWTKKLDNWRMKNVWLKLKALRPFFRQLNNTEYRGLTQKIEKARIDLRNIQGQLARQNTDQPIDWERETLKQLEKLSLMGEKHFKAEIQR
ncbi:hypothetical protein R3W88_022475 [Solanum pinnatisectum]|uniref:Uncharacterized protein n=1 Tax=Solanum pinnatisectum TaxID=50273 RepID=A0AAV9LUS5_9SOLN|nr:hypothetical protein R3W88_022475 [Solanum pinnatisectum]